MCQRIHMTLGGKKLQKIVGKNDAGKEDFLPIHVSLTFSEKNPCIKYVVLDCFLFRGVLRFLSVGGGCFNPFPN